MTECRHHWLLDEVDPINGSAKVWGICRKCGAGRMFNASLVDDPEDWIRSAPMGERVLTWK